MKYALLIAEKSSSIDKNKNWESFVAYAKQDTSNVISVSALNEGSFLCNLNDGLNPLSLLVKRAKEFHIPCRTLFFDQEPEWVHDKS
jgi:hypothetical protein